MTWNLQRARETYNLPHWSGGYYDVGGAGTLLARPRRDGVGVDLNALADELAAAGLSLPILVRFTDILRDRLDTLCGAFDAAIAAQGYGGDYTAIYPIKVNQQSSVVQALLDHGGGRLGLEAGSKPELMAVLALSRPGGVVVCNGYKDREYVRLALIGERLGLRVTIVVEKLSELDLVLAESARLDIRPRLGLRVRLASAGAGKWQNTGGEKSKFGLTAAGVLEAVERLGAAGRLDCLELLHFHLGSQIPTLQVIQQGMRECSRHYAELHRLGVKLRVVDVGGGLGVDYEGTRSRSYCSMNYAVADYAAAVVHALGETCLRERLPPPDIYSESGRALTAHHALLITDVIDSDAGAPAGTLTEPQAQDPEPLRELWQCLQDIERHTPLESYHNAQQWLGDAQQQYAHGLLTLAQRAAAERAYAAICQRVRARLAPQVRAHREALDELNERLAEKYFANFSLFQSLPDAWAIDQVFPVVPLARLDEEPTRRVVLEDITCDSDGRIDHYVDGTGVETTLPAHALHPGERYRIGIFLVGAYQEILGDMHNLFGDTDSVNVECDGRGGHRLTELTRGDTVADLLRYVKFDPERLLARYDELLSASDLGPAQRTALRAELSAGLDGYTYLEE